MRKGGRAVASLMEHCVGGRGWVAGWLWQDWRAFVPRHAACVRPAHARARSQPANQPPLTHCHLLMLPHPAAVTHSHQPHKVANAGAQGGPYTSGEPSPPFPHIPSLPPNYCRVVIYQATVRPSSRHPTHSTATHTQISWHIFFLILPHRSWPKNAQIMKDNVSLGKYSCLSLFMVGNYSSTCIWNTLHDSTECVIEKLYTEKYEIEIQRTRCLKSGQIPQKHVKCTLCVFEGGGGGLIQSMNLKLLMLLYSDPNFP